MTPIELLESLQNDLRKLNVNYEAHALIQQIIQSYKLRIEKDEQNIFNLAGSGFSSTARLAKSSPPMWESITMQNKENLLPAIESYIYHLNQLKKDIEENNSKGLIEKMEKANEIRKIIKN